MSRKATFRNVQCEQVGRIKDVDIRAFVKAVNALNAVMDRVLKYEPDANYYLSMEDLNLMIGLSHDDLPGGGTTDRPDRVALSWALTNAGGGDW